MNPKQPVENLSPTQRLEEKINKYPPFLPSQGHSKKEESFSVNIMSLPSDKPTWGGYLVQPNVFDLEMFIQMSVNTLIHPFARIKFGLKDEAGTILTTAVLSDHGSLRFRGVENKQVKLVIVS